MKYIASCSFGKDSLAMLIKIKELGLPLDEVIYCDIRFDNEPCSGEMPLMKEFIPKAEKILKEKFDIEVKHLTYKRTFVEQFYTIKQRGNHKGDNYGFPYVIGAWCNSRLKIEPINNYLRQFKEFKLTIINTYPITNAHVAKGGIDLDELELFEVKNKPNMFILGEATDQVGICGGFNLWYAFTSGLIAADKICK